jgi:hypothetical protein
MAEQVRENRIRRAAESHGLKLTKSRVRDPARAGYGRYWLGRHEFRTLDDVERYLVTRGQEHTDP